MTEIAETFPLEFRVAAVLGTASSIFVLLCYPPWLLQHVVLVSGMAAVLSMPRVRRPGVLWPLALVIRTSGGIAVLVLLLTTVSFPRMDAALTRLAVVSQANIAGWPLSFVKLDLLLGWPDEWRMNDVPSHISGQSLSFAVLIALILAMMLKFDRGPGNFARAFLVILFTATVAAYLAIWIWFGASYQQWKFATTVPLAYGFVISAAVVFLLLLGSPRRVSILLRLATGCVLTVVIGLNLHQYYGTWSVDAYDFPASLRNAKSIDLTPDTPRGYINLDNYAERMGASVFVNFKPVTFSGPTYWGVGVPPPKDGPFAAFQAACAVRETGGNYGVRRTLGGSLPAIPLGETVSFAGPVDACLSLTGFSERENFGRWTDGRHASIQLDCGCDLSRGSGELDIVAGAFLGGTVVSQTALFRLNGSPSQRFELTTAAPRHLIVKVPPNGSGDIIHVEIDLPDATFIAGSQETRALGLSVVSLEFRQAQ